MVEFAIAENRDTPLYEWSKIRSVIVKGFAKYWGYIAMVVLLTAWWTTKVGPLTLLALSVVVTAYFLLQAPVWCGAVNRDGTLCRKNSSGLLLGCSFRQHKWQKMQMVIVPHAWRKLNRGLWASPATGLTTILTAVSIISIVASLIKPIFT